MGAVVSGALTCVPSDMRNGQSMRDGLIRFQRTRNQRQKRLCQVTPGIVALVLLFTAFPARAQPSMKSILAPQAAPAPAEKPAAPAPVQVLAIPLPEIANQAEGLDQLLREVSKHLEPALEVRTSDPEGKAHAAEVSRRARQAEDLLAGIPSVMQLQDEDRYWHALAEQYGRRRRLLTERAAGIEKEMKLLDSEQARWQATSDQVQGTPGLSELAERIGQELKAIETLRSQAREQLNLILILQNRAFEEDRKVSAVLLKLKEAHERLRGQLFERDSSPLWAAREPGAAGQSITTIIRVSVDRGLTGAPDFLRANKAALAAMLAVYVAALLAAFRFRRYVVNGTSDEVPSDASEVGARPYSIALLMALLTTIGITSSAPTGIAFVVGLVYIVPVLRLLPALAKPELRSILYVLCVSYFLQWVHLILQFGADFKREMFALLIFLTLIVFAWLARPSRLRMQPGMGWRYRLLVMGIRLGLLMLAVSLGADIAGFVSLSQVIGASALFCGFTFALLYAAVRTLHLGLVMVLNSIWFRSLSDVRNDLIERWGRRILVIAASLIWINIYLYFLTARDVVVAALRTLLRYPIGFGKVHVTLGETLSLIFFLLLGYAIANIASFVLEKVLLPKAALKGGPAYAVSRVAYYILLAGLFFATLANAGLELNKLTVITGALGVGLGFGLQNIVSNFASGLIILFERPFRVGDIVEVSGVIGTVKRIGARSSTLLTHQYAEVIFPNSNLLSNQVTNWTLSSSRRRVEVPVGVAYETNPEVALRILLEVANSNPRLLKDPQPEAFFLGFGENALNLELRFWASQAIWFELRSEVGLAVLRSLRNAGITIPYPQLDLHVRSPESPDSQPKKKPHGKTNGEGPAKKTTGK